MVGVPGAGGVGGGAGGGRGGGGAGGGRGGGGAAGGGTIINLVPNGAGGAGGGPGLAQALQQAFGGAGLTAASSQMRIVAEDATNSLIVRATDADWALVQQVLGAVDLRLLQVLIEVTIVQVQRTHDLNLGISGSSVKPNSAMGGSDIDA